MEPSLHNKKLAVVGAGITGLTAAFYLLRQGAQVTVFEAKPEIGGLASFCNFGEFEWDRFYHCILTSDTPLLQLIEDLGLSGELRWQATRVGFFARERLHSVSTTAEFLRFPLLTLWDKIRLGLGILYVCSIRDPKGLEEKKVSDWLIRVFGGNNYRRLWGPLLMCKLGTCRDEASAAFMWATITRLYSTRDKSAGKQERLGYVRGGYRTVFRRLQREIESLGGQIRTSTSIERISGDRAGVTLTIAGRDDAYDHVITTIPSRLIVDTAPGLPSAYTQKLKAVRYLGIVCFALILKRKLSPFYVTNLCDEDIPFTGIIEMTNLISMEETAGNHLVYLPKYTGHDDPLFGAPESDLWDLFRAGLMRVVPTLEDSDIKSRFLFRERFVQPMPVLHYSDLVPPMETGVPGVLLANTTQIINSTLNNNAMVQIARQSVRLLTGNVRQTTPDVEAVAALKPSLESNG